MQVYKTFFRILWKQRGTIIMYICIFAVISNLVSKQASKDGEKSFEETSYEIAIFDNDNSTASKSIIEYMESHNKIVEIADDNMDTMQDELYNRNVESIIRIPAGYEDKLLSGDAANLIEVVAIPGTLYADTIESQLDGYIKILNTYIIAGYDIDNAIKNANNSIQEELEVKLIDEGNKTSFSKMYYSFIYIAYVFLLIVMVAIGPIIMVFNKKNVHDRIECSSYTLRKSNTEMVLGMITAGIGLCVVFGLLALVSNGKDVLSIKGGLNMVNMLCFTIVSISITFLVTQFINNVNALSMVSNIIGLGSSFLCGVFVPLELLSDGVIAIAKCMPSYWYVMATRWIDSYKSGSDCGQLIKYIGIQLTFAVVLFGITGVISIKRRTR